MIDAQDPTEIESPLNGLQSPSRHSLDERESTQEHESWQVAGIRDLPGGKRKAAWIALRCTGKLRLVLSIELEVSAVARITVEDCLENVDNRFQLVLIATRRARQIAAGSAILVDEENDKPTVLALREVAQGRIGPSILDEEPEEALDEEEAAAAGLMPAP